MKSIYSWIGLLGLLLVVLGSGPTQAGEPAPVWSKPQAFAETGVSGCVKCHDSPEVKAILGTPHGMKGDPHSPIAERQCESCHGPSSEHNNAHPPKGERRPPVSVAFNGPDIAPVEVRNKVCEGCHQGGQHLNWRGSQHESNDVGCSNCHTAHTRADPVLFKTTEAEKCFTCHAQQRAESFQFSHHPVREGTTGCSDCHNTHGSIGPKLLKEPTVNETCYLCHAEKRGPLLWEHEPVREDCSNCHTPHGSTQARLLKMRPMFLCTSCHQNGNHSAAVLSANVAPGGKGAVNSRVLARGCTNCHSQVHGSNSPAGGLLTR
jgi:DmsE family decaheme c-type cytochrome